MSPFIIMVIAATATMQLIEITLIISNTQIFITQEMTSITSLFTELALLV